MDVINQFIVTESGSKFSYSLKSTMYLYKSDPSNELGASIKGEFNQYKLCERDSNQFHIKTIIPPSWLRGVKTQQTRGWVWGRDGARGLAKAEGEKPVESF